MFDAVAPETLKAAQGVVEDYLDVIAPDFSTDSALIGAAKTQSDAFTGRPDGRRTALLNRTRDRAAYLAYFAPRTLAAVSAVRAAVAAAPEGVVIDVGAGTGAASLMLAHLGRRRFIHVEPDAAATGAAKALLFRVDAEVIGHHPSLSAMPQRAHLVVAAFALAEMAHRDMENETGLFQSLLSKVTPTGTLIVVDAGDKMSSAVLGRLRQTALDAGFHAAAPCPHETACPVLESGRDWCHTFAPRHLDGALAEVARRVGRDEQKMALSYLVLTGPKHESRPQTKGALRVLGAPRKEKGRVRVLVCTDDETRFLQAKKRDKDAARALLQLTRGDVVVLGEDAVERRKDTAHVERAVVAAGASTFP